MGARLALRPRAQLPDLVAAVRHVSTAAASSPMATTAPTSWLPEPGREVVAGLADHDGSMPTGGRRAFDAALDDAGVTATTAVYPGAAHGYSMADTSMYDEAATERHFTELRDLLDRTLR